MRTDACSILTRSRSHSVSVPHKRLYLRNILYNNETLFQIAERHADNGIAWKHWLAWMQDNAQAVPERDFSYLQKRFRSFHQFASLVGMIRSSTIESSSNKRWSSRFVFPFGRHAIYEDLNIKNGSASREYIYFGRTGELLYQMLVRSRDACALRPYLARAFERKDPCDSLLELLQPEFGRRPTISQQQLSTVCSPPIVRRVSCRLALGV